MSDRASTAGSPRHVTCQAPVFTPLLAPLAVAVHEARQRLVHQSEPVASGVGPCPQTTPECGSWMRLTYSGGFSQQVNHRHTCSIYPRGQIRCYASAPFVSRVSFESLPVVLACKWLRVKGHHYGLLHHAELSRQRHAFSVARPLFRWRA